MAANNELLARQIAALEAQLATTANRPQQMDVDVADHMLTTDEDGRRPANRGGVPEETGRDRRHQEAITKVTNRIMVHFEIEEATPSPEGFHWGQESSLDPHDLFNCWVLDTGATFSLVANNSFLHPGSLRNLPAPFHYSTSTGTRTLYQEGYVAGLGHAKFDPE